MAEASAKMHLRPSVRSDDIDLAIQVTIGSFVSAQKLSIKKQLERGFRKYLTRAQDHEELLAFLLGQIVKDKVRYHTLRNGDQPPSEVQVKLSELQERAREVEIHDLQHFLSCALFKTNGYKVVGGDRIVKQFGNEL
jgi:DNA replication licensing factor MCM2